MASSTTSGNLTVYEHEEGDAVAKLRAPAMALHGIGHEQTGVGRTQCMPLSAANTCLLYRQAVHRYGRVILSCVGVGEQDSAADG